MSGDPLRGNWHVVNSLRSALHKGEHGLSTVPGLLKRVLTEESWRRFVTERGEPVEWERLDQFVMAAPMKGIGATVELIERVIADDEEAVVMFREARKGTNNISTKSRTTRHGTRRDYALQRLEHDAPELHAEVLAGRLSAHAAMVKAGFRPRTFTVRPEPKSAARTLRKHMQPDQLRELAKLLTEDGQA